MTPDFWNAVTTASIMVLVAAIAVLAAYGAALLRRKLSQGDELPLIETIRGVGYRLLAEGG